MLSSLGDNDSTYLDFKNPSSDRERNPPIIWCRRSAAITWFGRSSGMEAVPHRRGISRSTRIWLGSLGRTCIERGQGDFPSTSSVIGRRHPAGTRSSELKNALEGMNTGGGQTPAGKKR